MIGSLDSNNRLHMLLEGDIKWKIIHAIPIVTAPRHNWRGFMDSEDPSLDNHREMPVEAVDF